jgi:cystathionine beta-lyase/cystathionine gamma-synthase
MRADWMAAAADIRIPFGTEIDWSSPPMRYKFMRDRDELDAADAEFDEFGFSTRAIHQPVDLSLNHPAQSVRKISGADNNAHSATDMLEKTLARLEGAEAGLVLSSGLAAFNMLTVFSACCRSDNAASMSKRRLGACYRLRSFTVATTDGQAYHGVASIRPSTPH